MTCGRGVGNVQLEYKEGLLWSYFCSGVCFPAILKESNLAENKSPCARRLIGRGAQAALVCDM